MRMKPIAILVGTLMVSASTAALAQGVAQGHEGSRGGHVTGPDYAGTQTYPNPSSGQQYQQWVPGPLSPAAKRNNPSDNQFSSNNWSDDQGAAQSQSNQYSSNNSSNQEIRTSPLAKTAPTSIRATTRRAMSPARTGSPDQAGSTSAATASLATAPGRIPECPHSRRHVPRSGRKDCIRRAGRDGDQSARPGIVGMMSPGAGPAGRLDVETSSSARISPCRDVGCSTVRTSTSVPTSASAPISSLAPTSASVRTSSTAGTRGRASPARTNTKTRVRPRLRAAVRCGTRTSWIPARSRRCYSSAASPTSPTWTAKA